MHCHSIMSILHCKLTYNPCIQTFFSFKILLSINTDMHAKLPKLSMCHKTTFIHSFIHSFMDSGERGMNPVTMTIINSQKEYLPSWGSNQQPPFLKSAMLQTELWSLACAK